ncbi:MAG: alpha/beta fold hydrolase [bacterium]|nr:alpha/beta fold hydrolase [bacterium]
MDKPHVKREFVFIHGYTGGPTDFANLPQVLEQEFSARTHLPLLPGHGTSVEELVGRSLDELIGEVDRHIAKSIEEGTEVVLIGLSFGAQAALYFASRYPVAGVIAIGTTHWLKFPLNLPGIALIAKIKPTWKKFFTPEELLRREKAIFYNTMPSNGLHISRKLWELVENGARHIQSPVFFIHSTQERIGDPRALPYLRRLISAPVDIQLFQDGNHSIFFSGIKDDVVRSVVSFVHEACLFTSEEPERKREEKATAIIPAFNEAGRIDAVIKTLLHTPSVGEIIVIDDGSSDGTAAVAKSAGNVRVLVNEHNIGKAASMERGVRHATHEVIFFCDADLIGFTPAHAEAIIRPVIMETYDMFIGMRGNLMQRTVRAWGLNSGERALRKAVWYHLPKYYKHRYRIEVGLNYYVKHYTRKGFSWKMFGYSQPIKESKYGVVSGTFLRWRMNFDVLCAYVSSPFIYRVLHSAKKIEDTL